MPSQASTLRETQAPIKEGYKTNPDAAIITLKSQGSLDSDSITCTLGSPENRAAISSAHKKVAGLHPAAGGPDAGVSGELCSGDMLLEALVACAGVTLKAVATALQIPLKSGVVRAEGDLDFKGTLGVDRNAPVGFKDIRVFFDVEVEDGSEVSEETLQKLEKLTERYCVVYQTIAKGPNMTVKTTKIGA